MSLTPAEFHYLSHPLSANGIDLLKYTLQDLCIKEVIKVEARHITIDSRLNRKRVRSFFCRDKAFQAYSTSKNHELFILSLLEKTDEFRFYVLRQHVKKEFKKRGLEPFKSDYVLKDLAEQDFTMLKYFPNRAGMSASKKVKSLLKRIETAIDITADANELENLLEKVGSNVVFLDAKYQDRLKAINSSVKNIENLKFLEIIQNQFQHFDRFLVGSAFIGGGGLSSFSGGYGGFGGGSFGGGGAVEGW